MSRITISNVLDFLNIRETENHFINCPAHLDHRPSLKIYQDHFHCFQCQAHGGPIRLYALIKHITVKEALKELYDKPCSQLLHRYRELPALELWQIFESTLASDFFNYLEWIKDKDLQANLYSAWLAYACDLLDVARNFFIESKKFSLLQDTRRQIFEHLKTIEEMYYDYKNKS